jgi:hypothetical protein
MTVEAELKGQGEVSYNKLERKAILDVRTFLPHQPKEVEEWSWRKMKNEKWIVFLDCKTMKLKTWKLNPSS